ncbi:MAG: D-2-hydroxyacid dehydrogenase [Campylobacterales bacterium]|nr:D-2-hydroxyacid dehydrogenase [Campylobacterales bacterium]
MQIVILDALTYGDTSLEGFKTLGEVRTYATTTPEQMLERIIEADVVVTNKVVITESHMATCKRLKLICVAATGMNNVDLEAAKARGIAVRNVAGYSSDSVVQHTFSMLFYLLGQSRYYDDYVKSGAWQQSPIFTHVGRPFWELAGKRWGIIGLGAIGRKVAHAAQAFGAEVCYASTSGVVREEPFARVGLEELLRTCDVISIHAPLSTATKNLLGYAQLATCKEGAVVLNLGRGGIVDEAAVARIVDERALYFGLDVLEVEPMKSPHPLLYVGHGERLYITPHIAWTSIEARGRLIALSIQNIKEFYALS